MVAKDRARVADRMAASGTTGVVWTVLGPLPAPEELLLALEACTAAVSEASELATSVTEDTSELARDREEDTKAALAALVSLPLLALPLLDGGAKDVDSMSPTEAI